MKVILTILLLVHASLVFCNPTPKPCYNEKVSVRIIGGEDCSTDPFGFMVSVQFPSQMLHHQCGGTIVNSWWVLSAAHCFMDGLALSEYVLVAGIADMDKAERLLLDDYEWRIEATSGDFYGQKSLIDSVLIHQEYEENTLQNDLALVQLSTGFHPNYNVQFAILPKPSNDLDLFKKYGNCTALGWGSHVPMSSRTVTLDTLDIMGKISSYLKCVKLPIITEERCDCYIKDLNAGFNISKGQFCTLYAPGGKDSCYGDSGGPLMCKGVQEGITSAGWGCAMKYKPALYVKVGYYVDWIRTHIQFYENRIARVVSAVSCNSRISDPFKSYVYTVIWYIYLVIKFNDC